MLYPLRSMDAGFHYLMFALAALFDAKLSNETEDKFMEDWSVDVRKYAPDADSAVIAGIVRHCGIALQSRDASLVSFSDKSETDRVRENFLKKKLGLTESDADLDRSIAAVGERMKADRTKNRVTVYYLLAEHFGKLTSFGKSTATAVGEAPTAVETEKPSTTHLGVAGLAAGAAAAAGGLGESGAPHRPATPISAAETGSGTAQTFAGERVIDTPAAKSGLMRWLPWLILAAALLLLLLYLGMHRKGAVAPAVSDGTVARSTALETKSPATSETTPAASSAAIPTGAGVTTEVRAGKPAVIVYFDTGKAEVAPAFAPAAASLKTYLDSNAGSKLTVSGFNDKTGNAAANAELSKNRAEAVQNALIAANIPAGSIELVKPSDTTAAGTTNAEARRVEVVVK
jgi:outer membrane protein OmpA-like peptidoglycan-associated protein